MICISYHNFRNNYEKLIFLIIKNRNLCCFNYSPLCIGYQYTYQFTYRSYNQNYYVSVFISILAFCTFVSVSYIFLRPFPIFLYCYTITLKLAIDIFGVLFYYCLLFSSFSEKFLKNDKLKEVYEHRTAHLIAVTTNFFFF